MKPTELERLACCASLYERDRGGGLLQSGQRPGSGLAACPGSVESASEHQFRQFFMAADISGDGFMTIAELESILQQPLVEAWLELF